MADKYGNKTGGGNRAGVPNKVTAELKDMIRGALDDAGGRAYLAQQAQENSTAFMNLIGKIIPKDVNATISGGITHKHEAIVSIEELKEMLKERNLPTKIFDE